MMGIQNGEIYVPSGVDHGGMYSRHYMCTMQDALRTLSIIDIVFQFPNPDDQVKWLKVHGFDIDTPTSGGK